MLNPDAKPGKAARRRATSMETSKFEKKRGRIRKKLENLRNGVIDSPCSSLSEGLDIFPGPGTVDELVGAGGNYIGSTSNLSPDFRPRASSNASSCGRLSPILRESVDLHDNQVPPMSPWGGDYYTAASSHYERYIAEEALAGNLANNMKLGDALNSPEFSFHHSPGGTTEQNYNAAPQQPQPQQQQPQQQQQQFRRNNLGENEYSPYSTFNGTSAVSGSGGGNHVIDTKADLDFIEQLDSTFDCNVDEVLQNELSLGGDIDFNFGNVGAHHVLAHAHLQQQHQAQPTMMFNPSNTSLHHLMNSQLMGSNGPALMTAGGGNNSPNSVPTVVTTSSTTGRPWVH
ncbi:unnamed protein product [Allacma fusca]|uniref:FOXO protein transactivation domain-containing protein n=1 Tax=Allacma fusca TaxID=39272 RepID=A0A8J2PUU6_9HEXA|nr:unnamed protein product [Allacma fusca]